jgi:hypothetical protein
MKARCDNHVGANGYIKQGVIYEVEILTGRNRYLDIIDGTVTVSGPWSVDRFTILDDKTPDTVRAIPVASSKTYKGECPCGIQYPAMCDYHGIRQ